MQLLPNMKYNMRARRPTIFQTLKRSIRSIYRVIKQEGRGRKLIDRLVKEILLFPKKPEYTLVNLHYIV